MSVSPTSLDAFRALALGLAFAGMLANAYELLMMRRLGFAALRTGDMNAAASVPILVFGAPYVILRSLLRKRAGRPFSVVFAATVLSGLWGLACGRVVLDVSTRLLGA